MKDSQKRMQPLILRLHSLANHQGEKEKPPPEGPRVQLDEDTLKEHNGVHVPHDLRECWHGTVVCQPTSVHSRLHTDFCLNMHKPWDGVKPKAIAKFNVCRIVADHKLWQVRLRVKVDHVQQ